MNTQKITWIHISVIALMVAVLYSFSLNNKFVWDDQTLIPLNDKIQHLRDIPKLFFVDFFDSQKLDGPADGGGYYRPLVLASFTLDYAFWGEKPQGYHLTNLILHALNALLVYGLLWRLTSSRTKAFWVAFLFAIHPLQVDSVAYISGRTDLLAALFILLSLMCLDFWGGSKEKWLWYGGAFLACEAALFSKETAVVLPLLLLLYLVAARGKRVLTSLWLTFPFFAGAFLTFLFRNSVLQIPVHNFIGEFSGWSWRFLSIVIAWVQSLWLFFWPQDIYFERYQPLLHHWTWAAGLSFSLFLFFITLGAVFWEKNRVLFFFGALFLLPLVPVLQIHPMFVQNYLFWTEHFFYLPSVGFLALLVWFLSPLGRVLSPAYRRAWPMLVVPLFCFFSWQRISDWKDEQTLFEKVLRFNPASARAHNNLALVYQQQGKLDLALCHLEQATRLNPYSPGAFNNLGNVRRDMKNPQEAITCYKKAIEVGANTAPVFHNLASIYLEKKDEVTAEKVYLAGISAVKDPTQLYNHLGMLYFKKGLSESAFLAFQKALEREPDYVPALNNTGIVLAQRRQYTQAEQVFLKALSRNPQLAETHNNLGNLYLLQKNYSKARAHYRKALEIDPAYSDPLQGLHRLALSSKE